MTTDQDQLAAEILESGFVPVGDAVPDAFADFVAERIAARPSTKPPDPDPWTVVNDKLDAILTLLRGGTPE